MVKFSPGACLGERGSRLSLHSAQRHCRLQNSRDGVSFSQRQNRSCIRCSPFAMQNLSTMTKGRDQRLARFPSNVTAWSHVNQTPGTRTPGETRRRSQDVTAAEVVSASVCFPHCGACSFSCLSVNLGRDRPKRAPSEYSKAQRSGKHYSSNEKRLQCRRCSIVMRSRDLVYPIHPSQTLPCPCVCVLMATQGCRRQSA